MMVVFCFPKPAFLYLVQHLIYLVSASALQFSWHRPTWAHCFPPTSTVGVVPQCVDAFFSFFLSLHPQQVAPSDAHMCPGKLPDVHLSWARLLGNATAVQQQDDVYAVDVVLSMFPCLHQSYPFFGLCPTSF